MRAVVVGLLTLELVEQLCPTGLLLLAAAVAAVEMV
jgi:hypothetical protein